MIVPRLHLSRGSLSQVSEGNWGQTKAIAMIHDKLYIFGTSLNVPPMSPQYACSHASLYAGICRLTCLILCRNMPPHVPQYASHTPASIPRAQLLCYLSSHRSSSFITSHRSPSFVETIAAMPSATVHPACLCTTAPPVGPCGKGRGRGRGYGLWVGVMGRGYG